MQLELPFLLILFVLFIEVYDLFAFQQVMDQYDLGEEKPEYIQTDSISVLSRNEQMLIFCLYSIYRSESQLRKHPKRFLHLSLPIQKGSSDIWIWLEWTKTQYHIYKIGRSENAEIHPIEHGYL